VSPTVAVFIPTYNSAPFLGKAIESVLGQTFSDYELLILDDASTDQTSKVVEPYLSHSQVTYLRNETNLGMAANWNKGISLSRGKYVAKLDADDFYHPDFLQGIVSLLEKNPSVGLAFCGVHWIIPNGANSFLPYTSSWVTSGPVFQANLLRRFVTHSATICVRRECYERLGGFIEKMRIHADWEMWTRITAHYDIAYVDKILASMVRHPNSCTSQSKKDTRTPDDFTLWLKMLDNNALPYQLNKTDRLILEAAMIQMVKNLSDEAVKKGNVETAIACARFLVRCSLVPIYEKVRYTMLAWSLPKYPDRSRYILRGSRWTNRLWSLDKRLELKIPAKDPRDALLLADITDTV
jgi:hypothetical protein